MRLARAAALATLEPNGGAPLTTLVGVASDFDGAPLFLMSTLSRHTRNIAQDPRVSLLLSEQRGRGDPLNRPRLTLSGRIEPCAEPRARERYLQRNPKAALYVNFADFAHFRLKIESVHFNGGFGRANALTPADILASREGEAELAAAEPRLIDEINARGAAVTARLAGIILRGRKWRAIGLDAEGLDLASGGRAARAQFPLPARDAGTWRQRLEELLAAG